MGLSLCTQSKLPLESDDSIYGASEEVLATIRACMSTCVRIPQDSDQVFKDECMLSLDTPFSREGLYVNLQTWHGFGKDYLAMDLDRSGGPSGSLYLNRKCRRVSKATVAPIASPAVMGIGIAKGFQLDASEIEDNLSLVIFGPGVVSSPDVVLLPCRDLPDLVARACDAVAKHEGTKAIPCADTWSADQEKQPSKYAEGLVQLPATMKISPHSKDWKCEKSGDTQNLWLNLSDGFIGGGRRFFDGTGGSNGALEHYKEEKARGNEYPLTVKLGTITPHGADVYSYAEDENDLVVDPKLADHLAHWGIDIMNMAKTDKSMAEMEVDLNMRYDWSKICEANQNLDRVRGPGLVGLRNLGSSCYLNAAVQLLAALPELAARYLDADCSLRLSALPAVEEDLLAQLAKVVNGLLSERYSPSNPSLPADEEELVLGLAPQMFRTVIGRGHPEFSSNRQQDAAEFFQHFLDMLSRAERPALGLRLPFGKPFARFFEFVFEERYECSNTKAVSYKQRSGHNLLALPVRLEDAENAAEIEAWQKAHGSGDDRTDRADEPKLLIPVQACLDQLVAPEEGVSFRGRQCARTARLATMPRYLAVQVQRYSLDENWTPCKLDCMVPMPDTLDLEPLRGRGLQPGEVELPEDESPAGGGVGAGYDAPSDAVDPEQLVMLTSMGFTESQVRAALKACQNSADRAAEWLFSHADDLDAVVASQEGGAADGPDDGVGKYKLVGFISHVGKSTSSGHYVCHIWKEAAGGWVLFNDEQVAKSETPPKDLGYVYMYQQIRV